MFALWAGLLMKAVCTDGDVGAVADVLADPAPVADLLGQRGVVVEPALVAIRRGLARATWHEGAARRERGLPRGGAGVVELGGERVLDEVVGTAGRAQPRQRR